MLTQCKLKDLFYYNPTTGKFDARLFKPSVDRIDKEGYGVVSIDGNVHNLHRLAFLYMNGEFPSGEVDHINHNRLDNRWCNLRDVSHSDNMKNKSIHKNNTSGHTGVNWGKKDFRWKASIKVNYQRIHLGSFVEYHEAVNARKNAEVLYGFHENNGMKKGW